MAHCLPLPLTLHHRLYLPLYQLQMKTTTCSQTKRQRETSMESRIMYQHCSLSTYYTMKLICPFTRSMLFVNLSGEHTSPVTVSRVQVECIPMQKKLSQHD